MKRTLLPMCLCFCLFLLSGCGVQSNFREVESLLVVRTMGIDDNNGSFDVTLASAPEGEKQMSSLLKGSGVSVPGAIEDIYARSYEKELFCYHVDQVIIGEKLADTGIDDCLNYICRSPDMRLDSPMFLVKGGSARSLIDSIGDSGSSPPEIIDNLESRLDDHGGSPFTAADIICALRRNGSALICVVDSPPSSESITEEEKAGNAAMSSGYGIIRGGRLCGYLSETDALAVDLLRNSSGTLSMPLNVRGAETAMVEIIKSSSDISPVWSENGELNGLNVQLNISVAISDNQNAPADVLISRLEDELSGRINSVFAASRSLNADFLGLSSTVERKSPAMYRKMAGSFSDILPTLGVTVAVSAKLIHLYDMKEANAVE